MLVLAGLLPANAQSVSSDYDDLWFYRVWFKDKTDQISDYSPEQLLSHAALNRRAKYGIPLLTESDIPVSRQYLTSLAGSGLETRCTSRWLNTAVLSSAQPVEITAIEDYDFIDSICIVKHPVEPSKKIPNKYGLIEMHDQQAAFDPRIPVNGHILHQSGLTGRNVTIAVLDAGFAYADAIESLEPLRQRNGIVSTWDFVNRSAYVFDYHSHGTSVLSILAGVLPGIINGTAPGADYMLLRTEDDRTEFPIEQDYWVAAAEYADSAGADIITSSLGYYTFDDPSMDYSFSDMDGNTTFVTRGADIAASKGILVVSSAGNERNKEWIRIIAPSDGVSVLGIGAVKHDLTISDFSSAGNSSDGRVKPDVVAPGVSIPIQFEPLVWHSGSGTSFSCPVVSGLCASLMQAVPKASPADIMKVVQESSDRYLQPDTLYGYGLPDFLKALRLAEERHSFIPEVKMTAGPNPFTEEIILWFHEPPVHLTITVSTLSGRTVIEKYFPSFAARSFRLSGLGTLAQGLYLVRVVTDQGERVFKMIRTNK
jgi:hypothetical protein